MAQPQYGPPTDRWNVNLPAVIGVVFVFLVGVIVWVVVSATGDGGDGTATSTPLITAASTSTLAGSSTTTPATTTPAPMPDLTSVTSVVAGGTSVPAPATTPTTAPGAVEGAVAGDLGVPGRPMQQPGCDGAYITIIASAIGDQASATGIGNVLDAYPTSEYLRTDQTCPSLNPSVDGEPIYVVYFGPFLEASDACAARANGTAGAYAKQLSNDRPSNHTVSCA